METSRILYEEMNKRRLCGKCQAERSKFNTKDKKGGSFYSNLLPGFSSVGITIPIDVLIVAEAHGGGRSEDFRPEQKALESEVTWLSNYYLKNPLSKFHQQQMRNPLEEVDKAGKSWAFTDLVKCYVWEGNDPTNRLNGRINRRTAINHCRRYLDRQIGLLQPMKILVLGRTVAEEYFKLCSLKHGSAHMIDILGKRRELVYSVFPARNTADLWIEKGAWEPVIRKLC